MRIYMCTYICIHSMFILVVIIIIIIIIVTMITNNTMAIHIKFIGWANERFNNLGFEKSLEAKKTLEMGIGRSLMFSQFMKCRSLK